jgi:hypothetical protein
MKYEYTIYKINTIPHQEYQNLISTVEWAIIFSDGHYSSEARLITDLPIDQIKEFVEITQVSKDQLINWCINTEGGSAFLTQIVEIHRRQIEFLKRQDQSEEYTGQLAFDLSTPPAGTNEVIL